MDRKKVPVIGVSVRARAHLRTDEVLRKKVRDITVGVFTEAKRSVIVLGCKKMLAKSP